MICALCVVIYQEHTYSHMDKGHRKIKNSASETAQTHETTGAAPKDAVTTPSSLGFEALRRRNSVEGGQEGDKSASERKGATFVEKQEEIKKDKDGDQEKGGKGDKDANETREVLVVL